jgi:hypothetical protein
MAMQFDIEFTGDVVERGELLNGMQVVTIAGASADGAWRLDGSASWNLGLVEFQGEGDLTLTRGDDGLFATLTRCSAHEASGEPEIGETLEADYEIDGGTGAFERAAGRATAAFTVGGGRFAGRWRIALTS